MKKEQLKKIKGLLYGVGLGIISISVTGCDPDSPENVLGYLKENKYQEENIGLIKKGEIYIPYYSYDQRYWDVAKGYYNSNNGEYIGDKKDEEIGTENHIKYSKEQILPYKECNPNAEYNYEAISNFTEETYQNLTEDYFKTHTFSTSDFALYEIKNLTTNEIKYVIARQINGTQVFNFETYLLEDYTGYAITKVTISFDKESYYYEELLDFITEYRKNLMKNTLEK